MIALGVVLVVVAAALGSLWGGFVASVLWGWFVVPVFDLPPLGVAEAIGLSLVLSAFHSSSAKKKKDDESWAEFVFKALFLSLFMGLTLLGIGWIVRGFV